MMQCGEVRMWSPIRYLVFIATGLHTSDDDPIESDIAFGSFQYLCYVFARRACLLLGLRIAASR